MFCSQRATAAGGPHCQLPGCYTISSCGFCPGCSSLVLSAFPCEADGLIWMPPSDKADALFRIVSNGRAGFIDRTAGIVIAPTLPVGSNWSQVFYDGLLSLGVGDGPFLNTKGEILDIGFDRIGDFSEGVAAALAAHDSKWGYIDRSGRFVISPRFPSFPDGIVDSFSDGLAAVETAGKLGYIDR